MITVIGKRFTSTGLRDILVQSGVVGLGSVAGVLEGNHYNRSMKMRMSLDTDVAVLACAYSIKTLSNVVF